MPDWATGVSVDWQVNTLIVLLFIIDFYVQRAFLTPWQLWVSQHMAMAFVTNTAYSLKKSKTAGR